MSTSSIRVPGGQASMRVWPSRVTWSVAAAAVAAAGTSGASKGFSARDRNRSACTRWAGRPAWRSASRTTAR